MAYASFMAPRSVYPWQLKFGTGVATKIVAASNSVNKNKADYVCDGTNDEVEIGQAISSLPSTGGLVWLLEGTYNISSTITISRSNVKITGGGHTTVLNVMSDIPPPPQETYVLYANNVNDIIIENLKIVGEKATAKPNYGIYFNGVTRGKIINCYITNMYNHAMWLYNSPDLLILGNIVESPSSYGIYLRTNSNRCFIIGNRVYNTGQYGIVLDSCNYCAIDDNYEEGSGQSGSNGYGIYLASSDMISVTANKLINDRHLGIVGSGTNDSTISSNYVYSAGQYGIYLASASNNNTVVGNAVRENSLSGIILNASHNNTITGNNSHRNVQHGIYIFQSDDNSITGNVSQENDVNNTGSFDGIRIYEGDTNIVSCNRCRDNDRYGISVSAASVNNVLVSNILTANTGAGLNDLGTDTLFVANAY